MKVFMVCQQMVSGYKYWVILFLSKKWYSCWQRIWLNSHSMIVRIDLICMWICMITRIRNLLIFFVMLDLKHMLWAIFQAFKNILIYSLIIPYTYTMYFWFYLLLNQLFPGLSTYHVLPSSCSLFSFITHWIQLLLPIYYFIRLPIKA